MSPLFFKRNYHSLNNFTAHKMNHGNIRKPTGFDAGNDEK